MNAKFQVISYYSSLKLSILPINSIEVILRSSHWIRSAKIYKVYSCICVHEWLIASFSNFYGKSSVGDFLMLFLKLGSHWATNDDIRRYLAITIRRCLTITLKISVIRFTLKYIKSKFWSSFDITSDSEEEDVLFLELLVLFLMKITKKRKRNKNGSGNYFVNEKKMQGLTI